MSADAKPFEGWAILELMGHRKLAGRVSEQAIGGHAFIRIDVPGEALDVATQFYSPAAIYCLTPTTEDIARRLAQNVKPEPVTRYELPPAPEPRRAVVPVETEDEDDYEGEDDQDDDEVPL